MRSVLFRSVAAVIILTIILALPARAEEHLTIAGLRVAVWAAASGEAKAPVVIFSHGFHGCATQSRFLTEALARAGYLVFAPDHRDATCDGGTATFRDRAEEPFTKAGLWSNAVYRDRADDIHRLVKALNVLQNSR